MIVITRRIALIDTTCLNLSWYNT